MNRLTNTMRPGHERIFRTINEMNKFAKNSDASALRIRAALAGLVRGRQYSHIIQNHVTRHANRHFWKMADRQAIKRHLEQEKAHASRLR